MLILKFLRFVCVFVVVSLISKSSGTGGNRTGGRCGCSGFQVKFDF